MAHIRLLCAADLHLGRQIKHHHPLPLTRSYTTQTWERLIDLTLNPTHQIDALLISGDLIDKEGLFIEIYGKLKKGLQRLKEKNIPLIAVAGNHDAQILAQFAKTTELDNFHLLGANGEWERKRLLLNNKPIDFEGLSFTHSTLPHNPLLTCSKEKETPPLVGLLHCDAGAAKSPYAPVKLTDFQTLPHEAWLLGHIHQRNTLIAKSPFVAYCGSPQGLDVTEKGPHGAELLTLSPTGNVTSQFIPLAPLRWESLQINLSTLSPDLRETELLQKIETKLKAQLTDTETTEMIGIRLTFEGRTALFKELRRNLKRLQDQQEAGLLLNGKWTPYFIESIHNHTLPMRDLEKLATGEDMVALLAKKLQTVEKTGKIPEEAYKTLENALRKDPFLKQGEAAWPNEEEALELYLNQGYALLDELLEPEEQVR